MKIPHPLVLVAVALAVLPSGCGRESTPAGLPPAPEDTTEAASQLEQTFAESTPALQESATMATEALRTGDYERAAAAMHSVLEQPNLTFQQGMVARNSMAALEKELILAAEAGDPNAKRAFEMLKRMHAK